MAVGQVMLFLRTGLETWMKSMILPALLMIDDDKEKVDVSSLQPLTN